MRQIHYFDLFVFHHTSYEINVFLIDYYIVFLLRIYYKNKKILRKKSFDVGFQE